MIIAMLMVMSVTMMTMIGYRSLPSKAWLAIVSMLALAEVTSPVWVRILIPILLAFL